MDFPYKKYFIQDIDKRFDKLVKTNFLKIKNPLLFDKRLRFKNKEFIRVEFTYLGDDYYTDVLSDIFNEHERIKSSKSGNRSLYDVFISDKKIYDDLVLSESKDSSLTLPSVIEQKREHIYSKYSYLEATQFRPTLAISVLKTFNPRKVLDISAGWGDRLLANIAFSKNLEKEENYEYVAFDPNVNLYKGYNEIKEKFVNKDDIKTFIITPRGFETLQVGVDLKPNYFDLVFSSPPFFDLEIYTKDETQSAIKYSNYEEWLINFLFKSLFTCYLSLKNGKDMIIHISDYKIKICEIMCLYLCSIGMKYKGLITLAKKRDDSNIKTSMWHFVKDKDFDYIKKYRDIFEKEYFNIYEKSKMFF